MGKDDEKRQKAAWQKNVLAPFLQKHPLKVERLQSFNNLEIEPLYTAADCSEAGRQLGFPGTFPYTRGILPSMYRGRLWTMRQYAGFGTAAQTNERFHFLLAKGQTGLSTAFDLPTQMGFDSDAEEALGEVGKVGVAIDSLEDMRLLMQGIDQRKVSTSMTINATAMILLALYIVAAEEKGIPRSELSGTVQNDILKEYCARGTYIFPPTASLRIVTDMFAFCSREMPRFNPISISGYHIREAGATAVQEIAFTFSNAIAYVEAALSKGLAIDDFAPRISFFFNAHNSLFEEIAKFRAARRLWAKIVKDRFGAKDPRSLLLRFHAQTAGSSLTAQQPENNIIRVTLQALAAVLGGCQSLHCNAMDEALALPSQKSAQIALRTQQILATEAGVADTIDPAGGSYFLEYLTDKMEFEANKLIAEIDSLGGAVQAIESGFMQKCIQDAAYAFQKRVEENAYQIVGVNCYQEKAENAVETLQVDPKLEEEQVERLRAWRHQRSEREAEQARSKLQKIAAGSGNLMPPLIDCIRAGVTLGEICATLKQEFHCYEPTLVL